MTALHGGKRQGLQGSEMTLSTASPCLSVKFSPPLDFLVLGIYRGDCELSFPLLVPHIMGGN